MLSKIFLAHGATAVQLLQPQQGQQDDGGMAGESDGLACRLGSRSATIHASEHGSQVDTFIDVIPIDI